MAKGGNNEFDLTEDVLNRTPTRKELLKVSQQIGANNSELGILLNLETPKIERIKADNRDCQSQTLNILMTWHGSKNGVTVRELCEALDEMNVDKSKISEIFR